jgi:RimJ/RimL family protein N-acetyltransferase
VSQGALPRPDPPLVDGAVRLRPWAVEDAGALAAAWADPDVACWTGVPPVRDEAAARRWIEGDDARRAAGLSLDLVVEVAGEVAGEVGLTGFAGAGGPAEIGWWIGPDHRRRGLATSAVRLVAAWAVGPLGLAAVEAHCHPDNPASGAVAHAAGFDLDEARSTPEVRIWRFERGG